MKKTEGRKKMDAHVISLANQKGGTAKTTTCAHKFPSNAPTGSTRYSSQGNRANITSSMAASSRSLRDHPSLRHPKRRASRLMHSMEGISIRGVSSDTPGRNRMT